MMIDENQNQAASPETTCLFSGSHTRAVDAKGRFNLPFKFLRGGEGRDENKFVVSRGADGSLSLFPYSVWLANISHMRQRKAGADLRRYLRRMNTSSTEVEPDSQGRIAVNREILAKFGIDKKVTIVGMGPYMELWDPTALAVANADVAGEEEYDDEFFR